MYMARPWRTARYPNGKTALYCAAEWVRRLFLVPGLWASNFS